MTGHSEPEPRENIRMTDTLRISVVSFGSPGTSDRRLEVMLTGFPGVSSLGLDLP